jgi:hypothetical protein
MVLQSLFSTTASSNPEIHQLTHWFEQCCKQDDGVGALRALPATCYKHSLASDASLKKAGAGRCHKKLGLQDKMHCN